MFGPPMLPATPAPSLARVRAVDGVALTVSDAERAAEFYTRVLFFEEMSDYELPGPDSRVRIVRMRLGDELMELIEDPAAGRSLQRVAIVVNDIEQAYLWLRRHRVQPVSSPQADWNPETAGIRTVHFNDPDGHPSSSSSFRPTRGPTGGGVRQIASSLASTTRPPSTPSCGRPPFRPLAAPRRVTASREVVDRGITGHRRGAWRSSDSDSSSREPGQIVGHDQMVLGFARRLLVRRRRASMPANVSTI